MVQQNSEWSSPGPSEIVEDSPYILIGSAGTELTAKNIYKKGHKSLKTQFLTCIYQFSSEGQLQSNISKVPHITYHLFKFSAIFSKQSTTNNSIRHSAYL